MNIGRAAQRSRHGLAYVVESPSFHSVFFLPFGCGFFFERAINVPKIVESYLFWQFLDNYGDTGLISLCYLLIEWSMIL